MTNPDTSIDNYGSDGGTDDEMAWSQRYKQVFGQPIQDLEAEGLDRDLTVREFTRYIGVMTLGAAYIGANWLQEVVGPAATDVLHSIQGGLNIRENS
jgi:hypothetical protein